MTDLSVQKSTTQRAVAAQHKIRFVTATSLFDGHDASINVMRRILQASGAEVIHLGHNRSVDEIVTAALDEDVQGIAVSSYQGGHVEFFKYMLDLLRERGGAHIKVFGGGGGVIVPAEVAQLHAYGVTRIYTPEDGARLGLQGMIDDMLAACDFDPSALAQLDLDHVAQGDRRALARLITALENATLAEFAPATRGTRRRGEKRAGARHHRHRRLGQVVAHRRTGAAPAARPERPAENRARRGGPVAAQKRRRAARRSHPHERHRQPQHLYAFAGDTRRGSEIAACVPDVIAACKVAGFDLIVIETSGIGQGDAGIVPLVDVSLYVMTPEYGAASQLEKIDMLDFADFVAINKFDRNGGEDALRDVRKQVQRNREAFGKSPEEMPVFGTIAARFNDDGVTALYQAVKAAAGGRRAEFRQGVLAPVAVRASTGNVVHRAVVARALSGRDRRGRARYHERAASRCASRASASN